MKSKLSVIMIAIMVILAGGIAVVLLGQFSNTSIGLNIESLEYLAKGRATYWQYREDANMQVLRTLAGIMGEYEDLSTQERRDTYDSMLAATLEAQTDMAALYTIWKPNALDGMDARYIGRVGSSPSGQYATVYAKAGGSLINQTSADIEDAMDYLNGPNAKKERVDDTVLAKVDGRDTFTYTMMVPVINRRTNETVGSVGCVLPIEPIQQGLEQIIREDMAIAAIAIYDNTGFILASYVPERIGKNLRDVETLYGNHINDALQAVQRGYEAQFSSYDPMLKSNVEIIIVPFTIGDSLTTWSIMIVATEYYMLREVNQMTRFTIMLTIVAMLVAAGIIFVVVNAMVPTEKPVPTRGKTVASPAVTLSDTEYHKLRTALLTAASDIIKVLDDK